MLGTTISNPLVLVSNNQQVITLNPDGSINFGSSSLLSNFTLFGPAHITGNTSVDGNLNVGGSLTTSCLSTACLNVSGAFTVTNLVLDSMHASKKIAVGGSVIITGIQAPSSVTNSVGGTGTLNAIYTDLIRGFDNTLYIQSQSGLSQSTVINKDNSGGVGVGVFPNTKLDVAGVFRVEDPSLGTGVMDFSYDGTNCLIESNTGAAGTGLLINTINNQNVNFGSGTINFAGNVYANQNVGIGKFVNNSVAQTSLQVNGAISISSLKPDGVTYYGDGGLYFGLEEANANKYGKWGLQYVQSSSTSPIQQSGLNFWIPWNPSSGNFAGNNFLFLSDGGSNGYTQGYVGIGTGNPRYKLDVAGILNSNEIIVSTSAMGPNPTINFKVDSMGVVTAREIMVNSSTIGADYVFDDEYNLLNIEELRDYLKVNKHLPNIPSASEMQNSGLKVVSVEIKLLEKIEELTLYLLEQDKRIKCLEGKLASGYIEK